MTDYKATPEQWAQIESWMKTESAYSACLRELRARVEALEKDAQEDSTSTHFVFDTIFKRLEALETAENYRQQDEDAERAAEPATACPHIVTGDEGTSYCALAEQTTNTKPTPNFFQIGSSLVERVAQTLALMTGGDAHLQQWEEEARAVIHLIADEVENRGYKGLDLDPGETTDWLRREANPTIQEDFNA